MSAEAWLKATTAEALFPLAANRGSDRKWRLFACGCARQVVPFVRGVDAESILEVAERIADRPSALDPDDQIAAFDRAHHYQDQCTSAADAYLASILETTVEEDLWDAAFDAFHALVGFHEEVNGNTNTALPVALARDVFGNPFRPVDFAPWRTGTALSLARQMYESRDFGAMPILADALQDAGCDHADVLTHCRGSGPHTRGCWVVDGVLGLS